MISSTFYTMMLLGIAMLISCSFGKFSTEQIDYYGKACNGSEDDLAIVKNYKVPTSETGKCLMKCMITKLGLLNSDGSYNKTGMEAGLKKYWSEWSTDKIETINNKCYEEALSVSKDVIATCNYSYAVMACLNKQLKLDKST
uniref:Odorant-binding protein 4 n=1 Tax=Neotoxoptera formosana TaxID=1425443 RepID=A0AA51NY93_9HEMI|nr:odorant-binding protein 4 [Neotoxoptera formosana]